MTIPEPIAQGSGPHPGLDDAEAARRLAAHGPNRLAEPPSRSVLAGLLAQFQDLLVIVLLVAAVLAGLVGDLEDTVVIVVVLVLNAALGFVQEHRAERSLAALRSMLVETATVRREGSVREVPSADLVPGDVVVLDAGDRVPADGRLVEAHGLEVDESSLTGESSPVAKRVEPPRQDAPIGDRVGEVFMNTTVTRGRGELVVSATGMDTEIGAVAGMLHSSGDTKTPLQHQLHVLGRRLAAVAGVAVVAFVALELGRGSELSDTLLGAVALAVAAIPEGLPAVVTVTLAVGTYQMARRGAIVKRLASVETLGATSVICSDKTGTLTLNQMTARVLVVGDTTHTVSGEGYLAAGQITPPVEHATRDAALTGALCNDSSVNGAELVGDPTEGALVTLATKVGLDVAAERAHHPRVAELPFESATKLMATFHRDGEQGSIVVHVKGALDVILARTRCGEEQRARHLATVDELAGQGLRVLGLARRRISGVEPPNDPAALVAELHDLELLGIVGIVDPPRPEARDAIARCRRAGIEVKMITGDHAATAESIAAQLGLRGEVVSGADLDAMDDTVLGERIDSIGVVARVAPEHKVRIVRSLRRRGHVVAMTGDGVNDAPALEAADIGVAMGITGTEVSKEAAAMVLTDDNFATIVGAVEQGRTIYGNIVTFVRFQLATNIGAILSVLAAPLLGLPVPFTAIQLLWVNIIMDGPPAMALGVDPPRPGVMQQPPRLRGASILTVRRLGVLLSTGAVMAVGTLSLLAVVEGDSSRARALTMAFTTFVFFQVFNAVNARTERASVFRRASLANRYLWLALAAVVVLQVLVVHVPLARRFFDTTPLAVTDWLLCIVVGSTVLWVEEGRKALRRTQARLAGQR